jgi:hypothetical protein
MVEIIEETMVEITEAREIRIEAIGGLEFLSILMLTHKN